MGPDPNHPSETAATPDGSIPSPAYDYIWFGGRPVAQEKVGDGAARRYTMTDHLGTPFLQTSSGGGVTWRAEYEPFGNVYALRNGSPTDWQPLRFPGQEERSTSPGRSYNIFRWYRPDLGQYTQPDPILLLSSFEKYPDPDLYAYVRGNPIGWADPLGLWIPRGKAYTACGGRGGIEVINLNTNCDRECTALHESVHVAFMLATWGQNVCRNRPRGWIPITGPHAYQYWAANECQAYGAGKQCRLALLPTCCHDIALEGIRRDNRQLRRWGCPDAAAGPTP